MPFSFGKRWDRGESWVKTFLHVLRRSAMLFFLGVMLHCFYANKIVWELWNVLTQLSVTYLAAFLLMRKIDTGADNHIVCRAARQLSAV